MDAVGRVCSLDTFTALDGLGVRALVFLHGCPLKCIFCSNPEAGWAGAALGTYQQLSVGQLYAQIRRLEAYKLDGITLSGGEPLLQPAFAAALMREVREGLGLPAALDTSGVGTQQAVGQVLDQTSHVLFCIKSAVPATYARLTGRPIARSLAFAAQLAERGLPWYLRYVLIPGMTDSAAELGAMVEFALRQPSLQAVELLPYHRLGLHKWQSLGLACPMPPSTAAPSRAQVEAAAAVIRQAGLRCIV